MSIVATIKEFFGYDQSGEFETYVRAVKENNQPANPLTTRTPLPQFRIRQVIGSAVVLDGQSVVLSGGSVTNEVVAKSSVPVLGRLPLMGRLFRSETKQVTRKHLLIFVTPTIIDPAGNRVHAPEATSSSDAAAQPPAPDNSSKSQ